MKRHFSAVLLSLALGTSSAAAQGLETDPTVVQGFYAIGLADEVRRNCPTISPRLVRAYSFLKSLEGYAKDAGYSDDDIRALKDSAARDQLEARIRADMAARGARPGNTAGYCQVGREEIARNTQAGKLLKND